MYHELFVKGNHREGTCTHQVNNDVGSIAQALSLREVTSAQQWVFYRLLMYFSDIQGDDLDGPTSYTEGTGEGGPGFDSR